MATIRAEGPVREGCPRVYSLTSGEPEAIVVTCSDPRFQAAFDGFAADLGLQQGKFVRMVISGGGWLLLNPAGLPTKDFQALKERIELHRRLSGTIRRLILITHDDCKWQQSVHKVAGSHGGCGGGPCSDEVKRALDILAIHLRGPLNVEVHHAKFHNDAHTEVVFEKLC